MFKYFDLKLVIPSSVLVKQLWKVCHKGSRFVSDMNILLKLSSLLEIHFFADIGYKPTTLFPSPTTEIDRIDSKWKNRGSLGVCSGRACTEGRRERNYPSLMQ